jgi:hypothetical protein
VLGKGKACSSGITHRRSLSKQSLQGQVSAKLTPEICINKAASNSRLTAASRQDTATDSDSHSQTCLQTLFFLSLPTFNEKTTELHLHAGGGGFFKFPIFNFVLFYLYIYFFLSFTYLYSFFLFSILSLSL